MITVVVAIDAQTGQLAGDLEIVTRGLVLGGDDDDVIEEAKARVAKALVRTQKQGSVDPGAVQHTIREAVSQFVWERARRRPMILPIVMEV
jgi:ribonuclease J